MNPLYELAFTLPASEADAAAALLAESAPQGWQENEADELITYRVHFEGREGAARTAELITACWPEVQPQLSETEARDWNAAWREFFTPIRAGRFEVLPPWLAEQVTPKAGGTSIVIEPKMAFGTGHHATTALCLAAISALAEDGSATPDMRFLDLGTGSGILGIALCSLGLTGLGLDIDPQAVECARENAQANGCADTLELRDGSLDVLAPEARFEVVAANILSGPLVSMAPQLATHVAPGGTLLLSGILAEQADAVIAAYAEQGMRGPETTTQSEWVCLRFTRPA